MRKILFFGSYFYPYLSGITTYPDAVLTALAEEHQVKILTFRHQVNLAETEKRHGCQIIRMPYLFRLSKGFISLRAWFYFWREVRQADVIILNLPNAEGLPLAIMAKLMGKKLIGIFHCQVSFNQGLLNKIAAGLLNLSVYGQMQLADQLVGYTQDYVDSKKAGSFFKQKFKFALPPVKKLPVDQKYLIRLKQRKNHEKWVGFAGRVSREKGLIYLVEALKELKNFNIRLAAAGPYGSDVVGEAAYYKQVKQLLEKYQLKHCFLGSLSGGKLGAFYQAIDLLVLPSINQTEAFGMVQAEAMLAGKPVIVTDLPGVRQPVMQTGMGLIVPARDSLKLSEAISEILAEKERFTSQKQQAVVERLFNEQPAIKLFKKLVL